jgi:DNA-binding winged helix-turn-helix (wHTH) protein/tetratricopeptide (TPR) repeat protein
MDTLTQALAPTSRVDLAREADFNLGWLLIRPSRREVQGGGESHVLQRRVMQVLVALAHSTNEVVSPQELVLRCWGGLSVSDDAIGRCIAQLRRLAANWPAPPFEIETIAGVGYRLEGVPATSTTLSFRGHAERPARNRRRVTDLVARRPRFAVGFATVLVAIVAATWVAFGWEARAPTLVTPVIAVRPLTAIGADPALPPLALRASDAIGGFLGGSAVRVVSGPNARAPLTFGGSVASAGGQLHLQLYLEDTPAGAKIWSREFVEPVERADSLIDEAEGGAMEATNIVRGFYGRSGLLLDPETALLTIRGSENMIEPTTDNSVDSVRDLEQALSRRPDQPGLHTSYAAALVAGSAAAPAAERAQMLSRARDEVETVIRAHRDTDGAAAHTLALIEQAEAPLDWVGAEKRLDQVLQTAPDNAFINGDKCAFLIRVGRAHESLFYCRRALSLRPHTAWFLTLYAEALDSLQNEEPQLPDAALDEGARLYPDYFPLRIYRFARAAFGGSPDRAVQLLHGPDTVPPLAAEDIHALELLEKARKSRARADADTAMAALREADAHQPVDDLRFLAPMALGRLDEAFAAADISQVILPERELLVLGFTEPLRRDRRYWPLAAKAGLVRYWLTTNKWPDFCSDPTYPLDCRAEARRVATLLLRG